MPISLLLAAAAAAQAPAADPLDILAHVAAGDRLCTNPDAEAKTCSTLVTYRVADDGQVTERAEVLIMPTQRASFEMDTPVEISGARICGTISAAALDKIIVRLGGEIVDPQTGAPVAARLKAAMLPFVGHRTCDTLEIDGENLVKRGEIQDEAKTLPPKPVAWVRPDAGFVVAPRG